MEIREGGLDTPEVIALLRLHREGMLANSPKESVHALDVSELERPDVTFWSAWEGGAVLGICALRQLGGGHGEIKSMRTAPDQLRSGVGAALVGHILGVARERGYTRLSLETGTGPHFEAAHALYRKFGFTECAAFGDYATDDPFSRFMSRAL